MWKIRPGHVSSWNAAGLRGKKRRDLVRWKESGNLFQKGTKKNPGPGAGTDSPESGRLLKPCAESGRADLGSSQAAGQFRRKKETVQKLLEIFGFQKDTAKRVAGAYPFELSGGMQQRAVAAMGTASGAKWILADEPSKGLDMTLRRQMYDTLRLVRDRKVKGMLIITHDLVLAEKLCDQVAVMYAGQILEKGPSRKVLKDPAHPYTQGLLDSLPSRGMHPMKGIAPAPHEKLSGCRFAPRCPYVSDRCLQSESEEMEVRGRKVRCFQYA